MILQFVKTNILSKKLKNFLTIFAIMISVMLIICIQNISAQLSTNVIDNISIYDIIVGKNGSSTGLVLNTVFYYGVPEGNIDISYLDKLKSNKYVKKAVPIGMGDSFHGYKLIGTSPEYFQFDEDEKEVYTLKEGRFIQDEFEVVLGSTVAKKTGLKVGDTFKSQHGLGGAAEAEEGEEHHHDTDYKVVGILNPTNTPNDTVLFTTIESIWHVHGLHDEDHDHEHEDEDHDHEEGEDHEHEEEHEEETTKNALSHGVSSNDEEEESTKLLTAVLVRTRGLSELNLLYQDLQRDDNVQGIMPTSTLRELLNTFNIAEIVVTLIAGVSVVLSVIMLFITMLTSSIETRKDISILRALGASRKVVFNINVVEMLIIAAIGIVLGFIMAHIVIGILGGYVVETYGLNISGTIFQTEEFVVIGITLLLSLIAGIVPAMMVYKTDATKYLK